MTYRLRQVCRKTCQPRGWWLVNSIQMRVELTSPVLVITPTRDSSWPRLRAGVTIRVRVRLGSVAVFCRVSSFGLLNTPRAIDEHRRWRTEIGIKDRACDLRAVPS